MSVFDLGYQAQRIGSRTNELCKCLLVISIFDLGYQAQRIVPRTEISQIQCLAIDSRIDNLFW